MFLINDPEKDIFNGSRGVVTGFKTVSVPEHTIKRIGRFLEENYDAFRYDSPGKQIRVPLVSFYDNKA